MTDIINSVVDFLNIFNPFAAAQTGSVVPAQAVFDSEAVRRTVIETLTELGVLRNMSLYVKLAGASGALAVLLGAYASHGNVISENFKNKQF